MRLKKDFRFFSGSINLFDEACEEFFEITVDHCNQGFAKSRSCIVLFTTTPDGVANCLISTEKYLPNSRHTRVIELPFFVESGVCKLGSFEKNDISFKLERGHYRLVVAQELVADIDGDGKINLNLFFQKVETPIEKSSILVRDDELTAIEIIEECDTI